MNFLGGNVCRVVIIGLLYVQLWTVAVSQVDLLVDPNNITDGIPSLMVSEGNSGQTQDKLVCVELTASAEAQSNVHVVVLPSSTAMDGKDFNVSMSYDITPTSSGQGMLTPAGQIEVCFMITIIGDNILEDPVETANLQVYAGLVPVVKIDVLIEDDDSIAVQLEEPRYRVDEGVGTVAVCAEIASGTLEREATALLYTLDGSATSTTPADYSTISLLLTFDQSTSRVCADVAIIDDALVENDETFTVMIGGGDSGVTFVTPTSAVVDIIDNDKASIGFEANSYQGNEGGQVEVCTAVQGSGSLDRMVTVSISTVDRSARAPQDYETSASHLTFGPSQLRACITIHLNADNLLEHTEQFGVELSADTREPVVLATSSALVNITDTNRVTIGVESSRYSVNEGDRLVSVCVVKADNTILEKPVTFNFETEDHHATSTNPVDFSHVQASFTFDRTTSRRCVDISIIDDSVLEDMESFDVIIASSDPDVVVAPSRAVVSIIDNDVVTIGLENDRFQGSEGEQSEVCASVRGITTLERSVTVRISTVDRSAQAPQDYETSASHLTFEPSQLRACITIHLNADNLLEHTEQFGVELSIDTREPVVLATSSALVNINDANRVTIGVESSRYTVNEGDRLVSVCVVKADTTILEKPVTFNFETEDHHATSTNPVDFSHVQASFTFDRTTSRRCVDISIIDDSVLEDMESFDVIIASSDPGVVVAPSRAVVSIIDNEKIAVGFVQDKHQGDGAELVEVCGVLRNGSLERLIVTQFSIQGRDDGTGIIFNPGETRKCVNVRFGRYDHVAMFQLTLSTTDQSVVVTDAAIDVTIVPEFIFTLDGLSLEIVLQGLRVDNFNDQRQDRFKEAMAGVVRSYCVANPCQPLAARRLRRQRPNAVTAESVVIRDIATNIDNQLQFKLLVLAGGETVVPANDIRAAVEASSSAFASAGFTIAGTVVVTTPPELLPHTTTTTSSNSSVLSSGATAALVVVFAVIFLLVAIFTVIAIFKCGERAYEIYTKPAKTATSIQIESMSMRSLEQRQRKDSLDDYNEEKEAEAAAERGPQVSVTVDL